jgi:hypothetical protein
MAHHHVEVADEQYIFRPETKRKLFYLLFAGILLFAIGLVSAITQEGKGGHHEEGHHGALHTEKMVASNDHDAAASEGHGHDAHAAGEHHETATWLRRLYSTLWHNNIFFVGLGIIGLFFVAIQYAAMAGWSAGVKRIPMAMGTWIPIAGVLTLVLWFLTSHDIFHWTHSYLYDHAGAQFDKLINKKAPFFFWPLAGGTFPLFYIARMVIFFGLWYYFFTRIRKNMMDEDIDPSTAYWYKNRVVSTVFLIIFGVSSSVAAWDWVMSIDTHWFSTMFGWYVFASWWVTGLATITLIVASLKSAGYLKVVNANHLHDLGKFCFAFSIFWTYIWFGQFLLIYYANIPEETVYFIERMRNSPYSWIFYFNIVVNFVLPFLLLMTRDSKRQLSMLKLVCPIIIVGHWFDFFNMVTPGVMKLDGGLGLLEIGTFLIFAAVYLFVVLGSLTKLPLVGKNDPMLQESLGHHI